MSDDTKQVNELLKQALSMETQQAFEFLAASDAKDDVVDQVVMLLSPSATRTAFMEGRGLLESALNEQPMNDLSGSQIQNIKIIRPLGHGGMGAVYLAEDITLKRQVAVKVLHNANQLNQAVQERFRREALILSQLDHPNICRIYNLIEAETVDYLVLELIGGETLKQAKLKKISQSKKFEIALALLQALQVAHSKNIIHRDLKPENIMLDKQGQVKVLDFGISRLSTHKKTVVESQQPPLEVSSHTLPGTVLGTLTYMSPEQAAGDELTTASDIYTLGLVFQELFSQTPVYADDLTAEQLLKHSTAAETQIPLDLSKDLTQLIQRMKSKSAAARPTAIDAIRLLENIQSKPAKRLKFAMLGLLVLVAGLGIFKHINDLDHEREQANIARTQAEHVTEFMTSIFKVSNPYLQKAEDITAIDLLDEGAKRVDDELKHQPEIQAMLKATMGDVYHAMGFLDKAKQLLSSAYEQSLVIKGISVFSKITISQMYAVLLGELGEYETAKKLLVEADNLIGNTETELALEIKISLAFIDIRFNLVDSANDLSAQVIDIHKRHPEYNVEILLNALNIAGMVKQLEGQLELAENFYLSGLNRVNKEANISYLTASYFIGNLAVLYSSQERNEEALAMTLKLVELGEEKLPDTHPALITSYSDLSSVYRNLDDSEQAMFWMQKSLGLYDTIIEENPDQDDNFIYTRGLALANYGVLLLSGKDYLTAKTVMTEAIVDLESVLGNKHTYVAAFQIELAQIHFELGEFNQVAQIIKHIKDVYEHDNLPFNRQKLKVNLLNATLLNQQKLFDEVDQIEAYVFDQLNQTEPKNQVLVDMAKDKFKSLKAERETL